MIVLHSLVIVVADKTEFQLELLEINLCRKIIGIHAEYIKFYSIPIKFTAISSTYSISIFMPFSTQYFTICSAQFHFSVVGSFLCHRCARFL